MRVELSTGKDVPVILELYRAAAGYQRRKGYNVWQEFEASLVEKEIGEKRHYKIISGAEIACVFTIGYSDPVIWDEKNQDPAVYLHRIATNPLFKGKGLILLVRDWALQHARDQQKKFLRMDTWGDNESLKNYYERCGFAYLGKRQLLDPNPLPPHYWGISLSLFEIPLR
jgi:GNAT superfamily N-acetyltransferase